MASIFSCCQLMKASLVTGMIHLKLLKEMKFRYDFAYEQLFCLQDSPFYFLVPQFTNICFFSALRCTFSSLKLIALYCMLGHRSLRRITSFPFKMMHYPFYISFFPSSCPYSLISID